MPLLSDAAALYLGGKAVEAVYLGGELVWSAGGNKIPILYHRLVADDGTTHRDFIKAHVDSISDFQWLEEVVGDDIATHGITSGTVIVTSPTVAALSQAVADFYAATINPFFTFSRYASSAGGLTTLGGSTTSIGMKALSAALTHPVGIALKVQNVDDEVTMLSSGTYNTGRDTAKEGTVGLFYSGATERLCLAYRIDGQVRKMFFAFGSVAYVTNDFWACFEAGVRYVAQPE
ncbi:hypothetical protein [Desulfatiglans anilini]|uniref:hypothetical protein n=1 Tax=Desulfatiglans anilini TaxID=90728 RepID=UPI0004811D28|nr:hypothetical protein [Desulfatiglans anilini]